MNKLSLGINKQKAKLLSKIGRLEISQDPEYDRIHTEYQEKRKSVTDTIRNFKQVSDHVHALSTSLASLMQSVQNTYDPTDPIHSHMEQISHSLEQFDENVVQQFQKELQYQCLDEVTNYVAQLDTPKESIRQRDRLKIEYDEKRTQLNKLNESKKSTAPQKIPAAKEKLEQAESAYNKGRYQAKADMAALINDHGKHMDPVVVSLQHSLATLAEGMGSTIGGFDRVAQSIESQQFNREKISVSQHENSSVDIQHETSLHQDGHDTMDQPQGDHSLHVPNKSVKPSRSKVPEEFLTEWYFLDDDMNQKGPFDFLEMQIKHSEGEVRDDTNVFGADMTDWMEVAQVPKLKTALEAIK